MNKVVWQDVKGSMVIAGTYEEAVKMMGDLNFLQALVNFPKEQINDETLELLQVVPNIICMLELSCDILLRHSFPCNAAIFFSSRLQLRISKESFWECCWTV